MTVIADWPHVPRQAEVQQIIDEVRNGYVTFRSARPPLSFLRPETEPQVDGIGRLELAAGEAGHKWMRSCITNIGGGATLRTRR
jgi:hypothetical protein